MPQKVTRGTGSLAFPVMGILLLLVSWFLLTDWQNVPAILSSALAVVHLPV